MQVLAHTLPQFVDAVNNGAAVRLTGAGEWKIDNFFVALFRRLRAFGAPLLISVAAQLILLLDQFEKIPVRFGARQSIDFTGYLAAAEAVADRLATSYHPLAMASYRQLMRRIVALRYRLEKSNGGWEREEAFPSDVLELNMHASIWKHKEEIFHHRQLSDSDVAKLIEAARYRAFCALLLGDPALRHSFFIYALRDCDEVDFFIEFPALQERLSLSNLQGRIGRMGGEWLKVERHSCGTSNVKEKIVTLPFEGKGLSILDPGAMVHFRGNYNLTVGEIFDVFKNKNREVGNLEFMANGIANWNVHKLGWWNADTGKYEAVPLIDRDWWKPLPLFEVISKEEAQRRYGDHLNGTSWAAVATSTRGSASLDYEQSHSYLEMAIPVGSNFYAIYDFGKFATKFPSTFMESLAMFCHTVHATIAYPDENVFYTHRQHAQHSFFLSRNQGLQLLELIRLDLIKARAGNFVYQIESENCAKWLHEKLEAVVGRIYNLFNMKLLDTEPSSFVKWIFGGIRCLPQSWQVPTLMAFHLFLGAYQETWILENNEYVKKSLCTHRFFETGEVYLPAFLHKQLECGALNHVAALKFTQRTIYKRCGNFRRAISKICSQGKGKSMSFATEVRALFALPPMPFYGGFWSSSSVRNLRLIFLS